MKKILVAGFVSVSLAAAAVLQAQEPPQLPGPEKEHEWLAQLVGEWDSEGEVLMGPDQPAVKCKGSESARAIGGFWVVLENRNTIMEIPMTGVLTLGYDPQKKKYVGTWIDSMTSHMWQYEGTVDETGKILTLLTEGPSPTDPTKQAKFKEVIEIKSKDEKVFTSSIQGDDGEWFTFVTINYQRKE